MKYNINNKYLNNIMNNNNNNIPWVEKYRPNTLETIILSNENKEIIKNYIKNIVYDINDYNINDYNNYNNYRLPNLLFYGPPGTGKTTTAMNLSNTIIQEQFKLLQKNNIVYDINNNIKLENIIKEHILHLNASDDRGIDVLRNIIYEFTKNKTIYSNKINKFIILDEIDYMTIKSQNILKNIVQLDSNVIFIFICNYISKLHIFIKSNSLDLKYNKLDKNNILLKLKNICIKENLLIDDIILKNIIQTFNSDLRSMINYLQQFSNDSYLKLKRENEKVFNSLINEIFEKNLNIDFLNIWFSKMLKMNSFNDIIQKIFLKILFLFKDKQNNIQKLYDNFNLKDFIVFHKELTFLEFDFNTNILNYYTSNFIKFFSNSSTK